MKIALLTDGIYPYEMGGMQKHSFYLAKYFALNKISVDLYHIHTEENIESVASLDDFTQSEKIYIKAYSFPFPKKGKLLGHYLRESYAYSEALFEKFRAHSNVDFVYVQGFAGWKLIEEKNKGYKCAPIGVNFHGLNIFQKAPSLRTKIAYEIFYMKPVLFNLHNSDFVFSLGGKLTKVLKDVGLAAKKIIEIPTGIGQDWMCSNFKPSSSLRKFIFIGRYDKVKGIEDLNFAIRNLLGRKKFEFHFIGFIPEEKKIRSESVVYWNQISDQEKIKEFISACDVLVCPSYSEGMPTVLLEAMASGLSVIASDVGAVNCIFDNDLGWLIKAGNRQELIAALTKAIDINDALLDHKKELCRNKIENHFLWEKIIDENIEKITAALVAAS